LQNGIHLAEVLKRVESERSAKIDNAKLGKRVTYLEFEIDKLKECNACSGDLSAKKDGFWRVWNDGKHIPPFPRYRDTSRKGG
jgi:hypothetical protein